jgi:hypothetical protein
MPKRGRKELSAIDIHVGSRLRMQRNELGMSQEKLADAFGLAFSKCRSTKKA